MDLKKDALKNLPGIDKLLCQSKVKELIALYGENLVKYACRETITNVRKDILNDQAFPTDEIILNKITKISEKVGAKSLRPVLNASGIILHTNLGRAPLGEEMVKTISEVLVGYNNLEFNLEKGARGQRNVHASEILKFLTGAEDVLIVNNNAAAVMFILRTFARDKEVIVSRGELIEIGGSFRVPDIMAASDCKMVEVGTTNKTKVDDYKNAITDETALFFKAHKSNYVIKGFTHEAEIEELVKLSKKHNIPFVYDIGSGLLRKVDEEALKNEPDVKQAIAEGIDLVCFSGDKLLGGPQAGIIAGKKKYIDVLRKHPMMRALRVCKTTLVILETACSYYLNDEKLFQHNPLFNMLNKSNANLRQTARKLKTELAQFWIESSVEKSKGQYGGGTLPDLEIDSYSVKLEFEEKKDRQEGKAKKLYHELLNHKTPVLTNLKSGYIYLDVLTIPVGKVKEIAKIVSEAHKIVFAY
jgi:L-seryl-tRNA(Ser) seleniumtransferase